MLAINSVQIIPVVLSMGSLSHTPQGSKRKSRKASEIDRRRNI